MRYLADSFYQCSFRHIGNPILYITRKCKLQLHQLIDNCKDDFSIGWSESVVENNINELWDELTDTDKMLLQQFIIYRLKHTAMQ